MNNNYELYHFGILGMKWGIRRFQNEDGTLTPAGKKRYDDRTNVDAKQDKKKIRKYESSWKYEANPRQATMSEKERLARMNAYKEKLSGERDEYKKIARDRKETLGNRFRAYREASKIKRDIKRVEKDIEAQGENYVLKKVLKETLFMSTLTGMQMYGNARVSGYDISESGKFAVSAMLSGALETAFFAYGSASADKNNYERHKRTYGIY